MTPSFSKAVPLDRLAAVAASGALLVVAAGCGVARVPPASSGSAVQAPPASPGVAMSAPAAPSTSQAVSVVNPTELTIHVDLLSEKDGQTPVTVSWGPIPPGGRDAQTIAVHPGGTLRVTARWTAAGATETSRPYTILYQDRPITPVTLTFDSPYEGLGIWTSVVWDPPQGSR